MRKWKGKNEFGEFALEGRGMEIGTSRGRGRLYMILKGKRKKKGNWWAYNNKFC